MIPLYGESFRGLRVAVFCRTKYVLSPFLVFALPTHAYAYAYAENYAGQIGFVEHRHWRYSGIILLS